MRHLKSGSKLGRKADHRNAMLANLAASVIKHKRVTTTISKAKAVRPVVEKLITLGRHAIGASKADNVHLRRQAAAKLRQHAPRLSAELQRRGLKPSTVKVRIVTTGTS